MTNDVPKPGSEVSFLRTSSTFAQIPHSGVQRIVRAATRVNLPANWPLIHEQTPGDACYIVLSGAVGIYLGRERVAMLGPGELVGEVALRSGRLRSATVSTTEPVELLRIEGSALEALVRDVPALRTVIDESAAAHGARTAD